MIEILAQAEPAVNSEDGIWSFLGSLGVLVTLIIIGGLFAIVYLVVTCFRKIEKGTALIRTGIGETKVTFDGMFVIPILHRADLMDISLKRVEIDRTAANGLICKDNMRADIKVAFFVRVNNSKDDVLQVAGAIGCDRASSERFCS